MNFFQKQLSLSVLEKKTFHFNQLLLMMKNRYIIWLKIQTQTDNNIMFIWNFYSCEIDDFTLLCKWKFIIPFVGQKQKNLHRIINIPFNKRTKTTMMMKKRDVKFSMFCRIGEDVAFEEIRRNKTNRTVQKKEWEKKERGKKILNNIMAAPSPLSLPSSTPWWLYVCCIKCWNHISNIIIIIVVVVVGFATKFKWKWLWWCSYIFAIRPNYKWWNIPWNYRIIQIR